MAENFAPRRSKDDIYAGCIRVTLRISMEKKRATTIGFAAIILWSTMVGLIRGVSEGLGPVGGAAMIYSLSGLLLIFTVGFPTCARSRAAICWPAACCLSAMKSASRCPGLCRQPSAGH
jgi:hypothetical protein